MSRSIPAAAPRPQQASAPPWHTLTAGDAAARLGSSPQGLSAAQAAARLAEHGPNALVIARPVPWWRVLAAQAKGLVVALLAVAAVVSFALGDVLEGASIVVVLALNVGIGFAVEQRARVTMAALSRMQLQEAVVLRDGEPRRLDARELVPGDVIELAAGDAVPADARLLAAAELRMVEAPLTGESMPAAKGVEPVAESTPLAERTAMVYKGTLAAAGSGRALVVATGRDTEIGHISELVAGTESEETPLEKRLAALGRRLVWVTLAVAAAVAGLGAFHGQDPWLMLETALALAVAAVPEGLPVVATITLALGMRRMARRHALVRRLPAVETLGSATVVCSDKTGTLTAGEMTVTTLWLDGHEIAVGGRGYCAEGDLTAAGRPLEPGLRRAVERLLEIGALANRARVPEPAAGEAVTIEGDPTEAALLVAAAKAGVDRQRLLAARPEVAEVPFSSERMLMATFHRRSAGSVVACVKGGPGRLLELCDRAAVAGGEPRPLDAAGRETLLGVNRELAGRGLRVLALGWRELAPGETPGEAALAGLTFAGFAGLLDPPAPGVADTIRRLRRAGVRTVMLTGDQSVTAAAVARELGVLAAGEETIDGRQLGSLSPAELDRRLPRVGAFSRVTPADKLRIVEALQHRGEIVGMLGDGVNDAPALKRADIGVAMGGRGTDVAKETAAVVLQDDRFETIAAAVEEGRVIFDNIRRSILYLFSCNLSEVAVVGLAGVAGLPLPLLPLQILWLNLVTDVFPALALAVEPAEPGVMERPPRRPDEAILSRGFVTRIGAYAAAITAVTLAVFLTAGGAGGATDGGARAGTLAFMTLALAQLFHVFNVRSTGPILCSRRLWTNRWVWGALGLTLGLQAAAVYLPGLALALGTVPLSAADWGLVAAASLAPLAAGQAWKSVARWVTIR